MSAFIPNFVKKEENEESKKRAPGPVQTLLPHLAAKQPRLANGDSFPASLKLWKDFTKVILIDLLGTSAADTIKLVVPRSAFTDTQFKALILARGYMYEGCCADNFDKTGAFKILKSLLGTPSGTDVTHNQTTFAVRKYTATQDRGRFFKPGELCIRNLVYNRDV